jgi:hypothetical protein
VLHDPDLFEQPFGEGDRPLFEVLNRWYRDDPPERLLWAAAELYEGASPAMIQAAARWLAVAEELRAAGLDEGTVARVFISAAAGTPPGWVPPGPVLVQVLDAAGEAVDLAAIADALVELEPLPATLAPLLSVCTAALARRGVAIPPSYDERLTWYIPWTHLRAIVEALAEDRRDALLSRLFGNPGNANAARVQLRYLMPVLDLAQGPRIRAAIAAACAKLDGEDDAVELRAAVEAGGGPPPERDGPTPECRGAVEYWLDKYAAKRRVEAIDEVAKAAHERAVTVDAPELESFARWNAAPDARRRAIAEQIASQVEGLELRGLEPCDAGPIATFTWDDLLLRLIPGGSYERGFSPEEQALVEAEAEARRPAGDNWDEEFGAFLTRQLDSMRPLTRVTVPALLVCASPGYAMAPDEVTAFLDETPWRLLSESEWEQLARGGRARELTWRGHVVPDEEWFLRTSEAGEAEANPFGLWGFGLQPELCADRWHPSYVDASTDAAPRWGPGPRVARGGAAMLYPWQQCGEWQLLCSAVRSPASHWKYEVQVRPALGVHQRA